MEDTIKSICESLHGLSLAVEQHGKKMSDDLAKMDEMIERIKRTSEETSMMLKEANIYL